MVLQKGAKIAMRCKSHQDTDEKKEAKARINKSTFEMANVKEKLTTQKNSRTKDVCEHTVVDGWRALLL